MLKRALDLDGTNFSAAYNLGATYARKQMAPEAVASFRETIRIAPDYAPGHRALGELLLYQGQTDESLAELRQAVALDPNDANAHAALAKALSAKHLNAEANEEMRKAQQGRPQ
jgi:tetratricopeptide (TPR) repeat protein